MRSVRRPQDGGYKGAKRGAAQQDGGYRFKARRRPQDGGYKGAKRGAAHRTAATGSKLPRSFAAANPLPIKLS